MDLSEIFGIICLIELFIFLIVETTLINHCVPFFVITIFYVVGSILFLIFLSLSLFFKYGGFYYAQFRFFNR